MIGSFIDAKVLSERTFPLLVGKDSTKDSTVKQKRVAFERHLVRFRQDMSDDVIAKLCFPLLE